MKYRKPPLTFQEQYKILQNRGLVITDESAAIDVLQNINYYRLSAYFSPFQIRKDVFNTGTTIDNILFLYEFDRQLRLLLAELLADIEISIRTHIAYHLSHCYGAFGYADSSNFYMRFNHFEWLKKAESSLLQSHEIFVKHFRSKYKSEKHLPAWMICEVISFGQISQLFRGLKKHDRQAIAREYYGIDQMVMISWLHTLVYVRNLCAHHCRIWNRTLAIRPKILHKSSSWEGTSNDKIFCVILILKHLTYMQQKWKDWIQRLLTLLETSSLVDISKMGFPDDWKHLI